MSKQQIFCFSASPDHMYWKVVLREADFDWSKYIEFTITGGFTWEGKLFNFDASFTATEKLVTNEDDNYGSTQIFFYHALNASGYTECSLGGAFMRFGYIEYSAPTTQ